MMQQPRHDDIARRAYELYLSRGATDGLALADWLEAERELARPQKRAGTTRASSRRKTRR
jgi:DUF2934 family protein